MTHPLRRTTERRLEAGFTTGVLTATLMAAAVLAAPGRAAAAPDLPTYLDPAARAALGVWLAKRPDHRLLDDTDCRCDDDLKYVRTRSGPDVLPAEPGYHPYVVVGDFDSDGVDDLAVAVATRSDSRHFRVLILRRYRAAGAPAPYLSEPIDKGEALFFGPPRPRPLRLVVGPFDAEGGVFQPARKGGFVLR